MDGQLQELTLWISFIGTSFDPKICFPDLASEPSAGHDSRYVIVQLTYRTSTGLCMMYSCFSHRWKRFT